MSQPVPVPAWLLFAAQLVMFLLGFAVAQLNFWLVVHRPARAQERAAREEWQRQHPPVRRRPAPAMVLPPTATGGEEP